TSVGCSSRPGPAICWWSRRARSSTRARAREGVATRRRDVQLGRILDSGYGAGLVGDRFGTIVVLSGLVEGEQVIGSDAFFLDAERRLQASHGNPAEVMR